MIVTECWLWVPRLVLSKPQPGGNSSEAVGCFARREQTRDLAARSHGVVAPCCTRHREQAEQNARERCSCPIQAAPRAAVYRDVRTEVETLRMQVGGRARIGRGLEAYIRSLRETRRTVDGRCAP